MGIFEWKKQVPNHRIEKFTRTGKKCGGLLSVKVFFYVQQHQPKYS